MPSLSEILQSSVSPRLKEKVSPSPKLDEALRGFIDGARTPWPQLRISDADFVKYLGERLDPNEDPLSSLGGLNGGDLYLACACARGLPGALVQLERRYLTALREPLARSLGVSAAFVDDVQQALREKLFISQGGKPAKILAYSGRGSLGSWLRSAAIRTALNLRPAVQSEPLDELFAERAVGTDNQEMRLLKARCSREFKDAFQRAIAEVSSEELECLRLNLIEGLSIDRLAEIFGVSRATAARRLAGAA